MESGKASRTALAVAMRRASHQLRDRPLVLEDPIALRILDPESRRKVEQGIGRLATSEGAGRAWMAVRSRMAEDALAQAVARGVDQYVVLGAGLDTFACRNPYVGLRVVEVDFPDTQAWKRTLLAEAGIRAPESVTFAPVDFESQTLREGLQAVGFDFARPAFFSWLGVVMYLTLEAFRSTAATLGAMPEGSGVALDYMASRDSLGLVGHIAYDTLSRRVEAVGEPFRLAFRPEEIAAEMRSVGFSTTEDLDAHAIADRYLSSHPGAFWLRQASLGRILTAWR